MVKVYLSGKMSGRSKAEYEEQFSYAEDFYTSCGFDVVNPCNISCMVLAENPEAMYEDFMLADIEALKTCTHIAMLEGWETSKGANREKKEAEKLGLEVMYFRQIGQKK